jgi:hypothetical protein
MEVTIDGGNYSHHRETLDPGVESDDWAVQYQEYLDENAVESGIDGDVKDVDAEVEDWAVQYARYCEGKEGEFFGTRGGDATGE